ncbi:hypothetical protein RZN25_11410 [Bacillaceae bacterium S4-13-56]
MGSDVLDILTKLDQKLDLLTEEQNQIKQQMQQIQNTIKQTKSAKIKNVSRNQVGLWNVKLGYPDVILKSIDNPGIGFPKNKQPLANKVKPGTKVFIYLTHPVKRIIGYGEVSSAMKTVHGDRWPYQFDVDWIVGPCFPGVSFKDVDLDIRPRPGDTNFKIHPKDARNVIDQLKKQRRITQDDIDGWIEQKK